MLAVVLVALSTAPALAKPAACPDGRFLLPEGTAILAPAAAGRQGIALAAKTITLDGSCGTAKARVKAAKRATRVAARWRSCGERTRVVLKGTLAAPDCGTLRGKVKARRTPALAFAATRSACGDGYADTAGGETCDLGAADDELSIALLLAVHDLVAGGATDVPLSPDGTLRFVRTTTPTGGTDAIVRGGATLVRWVHDGDATSMVADRGGDQTPELAIDATRARPVRPRSVCISTTTARPSAR
ncbi:MAG: hypothetical protein KIT14_09285 [bacterium]|nr:hypothetical protein [bacterium]